MAISTEFIGPEPGDLCFYCGQDAGIECIYWAGTVETDCHLFFLHRDCVLDLMIRLMRDVHEWDVTRFSEVAP
jgi:hypothetical protein